MSTGHSVELFDAVDQSDPWFFLGASPPAHHTTTESRRRRRHMTIATTPSSKTDKQSGIWSLMTRERWIEVGRIVLTGAIALAYWRGLVSLRIRQNTVCSDDIDEQVQGRSPKIYCPRGR